ncbi:MAG: protein kinase domain-containing protein [Myxococcota bacterium]
MRLGGFHLVARAGVGATGEVWRGTHRDTPVAVKVATRLPAELRDGFRHEVRAVAGLAHPNVVRVYDQGEVGEAEALETGFAPGTPWLAMELAEQTLLPCRGRLSWPRLREVLGGVLAGLAHAHARGIVHRDLKLGNVLLADGVPKLADFGLAGPLAGSTVSGTPGYMAPEQIRGEVDAHGPWTDLYALGCLAWALATGSLPFVGEGDAVLRAHLADPLPPFAPRVDVPEGLHAWLARLLEKDPGLRFRRAADALLALDEPGAGLPPMPPDWRRPEPEPERLVGAGLGLWGLREVPLVGRDAERDRLWGALAAVHADGLARAVVVSGPAGTGKTRLAAWLRDRAHEAGVATCLTALHGPRPGPAEGLGPMVARHFGLVGLARDAVRARAGDDVAAAIHAPTAEERHAGLRAVLRAIAADGRVVLLKLDDAQWGADALALCAALAGEALPVLMVLTVRAEALADRPREAALLDRVHGERIALEPLPPEARPALVRGLLGLTGELAARVEARTDGNPLFAVQLVGDWVQRGILAPSEGGFALVEGARVEIPAGLANVWLSRLEQALFGRSPADARAIEVAAVLGQDVDVTEWVHACRRSGAVASRELVDALAARGLARVSPGRWSFAHGMLREAVEARAAEAGRLADHHVACAAMLEDRAGGPRAAERMGLHLVAAGLWAFALSPLLAGIEERTEACDYPAAEALLARRAEAMDALGLAEGERARQEQAIAAATLALYPGGRVAEAEALAERAGELSAGWPDLRGRALRIRGRCARGRGDLAGALTLLRSAERVATARPELRACRQELGETLLQMARLAAAETAFVAARSDARACADGIAEAWAWEGLARVAQQCDDHDRAAGRFARARELFEASGNRRGVAMSLNSAGDAERARGRLAEAEALYLDARRAMEAIGAWARWIVDLNLVYVDLERGRYAEGLARATACVGPLGALGRRQLVGAAELYLACCAAGLGDWEAWDTHLPRAAAVLRETGFVEADLARVATHAAKLAEAAGQRGRAVDAAAVARAQCRALGRAPDGELPGS